MLKGVHYYFGYGMNTNKGEMAFRCPTAQSVGSAVLMDHAFAFRRFADVYPNEGSVVHGALWTIREDDLRALDMLEGYPVHYDREIMDVVHDGKYVKAWVYYMQDQSRTGLPSNQYLYCLTEGYEQHGLPDSQLDRALREQKASMYDYYSYYTNDETCF